MTEFELFPAEDSMIKCNKPDGTSIELDALELDCMLREVYAERNATTLSLSTILKDMTAKFESVYGFKMSLRSMDKLLVTKDEVLDQVKKNTYQSSEPLDSTEQQPDQTPKEN